MTNVTRASIELTLDSSDAELFTEKGLEMSHFVEQSVEVGRGKCIMDSLGKCCLGGVQRADSLVVEFSCDSDGCPAFRRNGTSMLAVTAQEAQKRVEGIRRSRDKLNAAKEKFKNS